MYFTFHSASAASAFFPSFSSSPIHCLPLSLQRCAGVLREKIVCLRAMIDPLPCLPFTGVTAFLHCRPTEAPPWEPAPPRRVLPLPLGNDGSEELLKQRLNEEIEEVSNAAAAQSSTLFFVMYLCCFHTLPVSKPPKTTSSPHLICFSRAVAYLRKQTRSEAQPRTWSSSGPPW